MESKSTDQKPFHFACRLKMYRIYFILSRFSAICYNGGKICDFLFAFLLTKPLLEGVSAPHGSILKGKNLLFIPGWVNSFLIEKTVYRREAYEFESSQFQIISRKHAYIILTPLKPHFYLVKLGFTGVNIIFLFLLENIDCWYWLEPPQQGSS